MSHFCVIVVTKDANEATLSAVMQPYHEFECTGTSDQYVISVDETEEARAEYSDNPDYKSFAEFVESYYGRKRVEFGAEPDLANTHKYGFYRVLENGEVTEVVRRTKPEQEVGLLAHRRALERSATGRPIARRRHTVGRHRTVIGIPGARRI